mgnify:CR=1 FL=1
MKFSVGKPKTQLRHNIGVIHTSVTWSKWNMDDFFGLKFHLSYERILLKSFYAGKKAKEIIHIPF